jgi:Ni/Co efflux regulator RcnB
MNRKHLAMSTLPAAPLGVAGASSLIQAGSYHDPHRDGCLPACWRRDQYVAIDWREHHLRPPPKS